MSTVKPVFVVPNSKVYHFIPWNSQKNIGKSYNDMMSLVGPNDWVCFLDGDAVHTTHHFGFKIEEVIKYNPTYSMFTCYTNRVACKYQVAPNVNWGNNDQSYHRTVGENLWNSNKTDVIDITNNPELSGVLILLKKSAWEKVGGFKENKMLTVDNDMHVKIRNAGLRVGLMKGIYVQHWYRGGDINNKKHLL